MGKTILFFDELTDLRQSNIILNWNNRNTRQLVNKIRRFIDWIENNEDYLATYYHTGDGLYVIRKKNKDE